MTERELQSHLVIDVAGVPDHDPETCSACLELGRRTPLKRGAFKPKSRPRPALVKAKKTVRQRSAGRCEYLHDTETHGEGYRRCFRAAVVTHHRKRRSQGGPDTPENLLDLCDQHHGQIHANVGVSIERGYLIPSYAEVTPL